MLVKINSLSGWLKIFHRMRQGIIISPIVVNGTMDKITEDISKMNESPDVKKLIVEEWCFLGCYTVWLL
jgi:hypothetical protein